MNQMKPDVPESNMSLPLVRCYAINCRHTMVDNNAMHLIQFKRLVPASEIHGGPAFALFRGSLFQHVSHIVWAIHNVQESCPASTSWCQQHTDQQHTGRDMPFTRSFLAYHEASCQLPKAHRYSRGFQVEGNADTGSVRGAAVRAFSSCLALFFGQTRTCTALL